MFQIWDIDIKDITVGITRIRYLPMTMEMLSFAFNISHNISRMFSV